jgi:hypothetical protein
MLCSNAGNEYVHSMYTNAGNGKQPSRSDRSLGMNINTFVGMLARESSTLLVCVALVFLKLSLQGSSGRHAWKRSRQGTLTLRIKPGLITVNPYCSTARLSPTDCNKYKHFDGLQQVQKNPWHQ